MKEKILKAISEGLMNALSTDITDHDIEFEHDNIDNEYIRYEYKTVDMGKAGIWCEYNIGAYPGLKPENWYGDYYAWGEVETKDDYSWGTYEYCEGTRDAITKYNETDGLKCLDSKGDVVTQTLGEKFRMPTQDDYSRLIKNTTNEWVKNYKGIQGLNGRLFTAKNGNTLFFPASGYYDGSEHDEADEYCYVWTVSLNSYYHSRAYQLDFSSDGICISDSYRYNGLPVRGIQSSSAN